MQYIIKIEIKMNLNLRELEHYFNTPNKLSSNIDEVKRLLRVQIIES